MAILPGNSSNLDLTISVPSFSSSSPPSGEERITGGREYLSLDINQVPLSDEEDEDVSQGNDVVAPPRKKLRLSKEQSRLLEDSFRQNHSLNPKQKDALAKQLMLRPRQVEVWFQNRRARSKLKQTEMECEYLKRWFGSLTEQNRRLQREVEELRAMKVGPPTLISTHTMCPRCERITAAAIAAPTSAATAAGAVLKAPPLPEESHARRQGPEQ